MLSLLNIGSTAATAFSAFTALSSLGLYTSYVLAIGCTIHARLTGHLGAGPNAVTVLGEWRMWKGWGLPVNIFAFFWTIYLTIWLPFPPTLPVTGTNMNYAGPIYVSVVIGAIGAWFVWGQTNWKGPSQMAMDNVHDS